MTFVQTKAVKFTPGRETKSCRAAAIRLARIFVVAAAIRLSGCAASGKQFEPETISPDQGIVYIYRYSESAGHRVSVSIDGERLGALASDGYLFAIVSPGPHSITAGENRSEANIDVTAGSTSYIELQPRFGWIESGAMVFERSPGEAMPVIRQLRYSGG